MDEQKPSAQHGPQGTWGESDDGPTWGSTPPGGPTATGGPDVRGGPATAGGPAWAPPGPPLVPPFQQQTEGLAIGALICAIANFFLWILVPAIVALVLASQASKRIKKSGGALGGHGLVVAARIIATIALVLNVVGGALATWIVVEGVRETQEAEASGQVSVFLLEPGDCFTGATDGLVTAVQLVGCDQPHDAEVITNLDLPDGPFPGDDAVSNAGEAGCFIEFEEYVGIAFEESAFDLRFYLPNEDTWASGDRSVTCMVGSLDGEPLVGSARGTGQ